MVKNTMTRCDNKTQLRRREPSAVPGIRGADKDADNSGKDEAKDLADYQS